ncbi:MAG: TraR/DksA C4-type zinc finger protein [Gammaproteobacteria bacterium]|nr:TraR/DksA C4-type zinc finger protein [Gammaproteobacteria bacterium]
MNKDQIDEIRQLLLNMRTDLQEQEEQCKGDGKPVNLDQSKVGRLSRMDAMQIQEMALEASRRRQQKLIQIELTLKRIETDDYGYCLNCDEEINIKRLLIDPTNTHCIQCAEMIHTS